MEKLKYELNQELTIIVSGETGEAIGRIEYATSEPRYLLRYSDSDGRAVEQWWDESALVDKAKG